MDEKARKELDDLKVQYKELTEQVSDLKYKEYLLEMILSNIPQSIYFKDLNGVYTGASKSTAKKYGLREVQIKPFSQVIMLQILN